MSFLSGIHPAARRVAALLAAILLTACGQESTTYDPNARPNSPLDLHTASASLDLSGPVSGHISEVRVAQCSTRQDGTATDFYGSIYFQLDGQWYFFQLTTSSRLPVATNSQTYTSPGKYEALVDFRDLIVAPGGILNGEHSWGVPVSNMAAMVVGPAAKSVTVQQVANANPYQPRFIDELELWPAAPDESGPPPQPTPSPDRIVRIRGSWSC